MKNKLFLSILAAFGLAGASSQAQTVTFVDVATSGEFVSVVNGTGASVNVDATVLTRSQRWTRDKVYILARNVIVPSGVTLTIEPGTLIRAERPSKGQGASGAEAALSPADPGALVVARGGRIIATGTADAPIIFTTMDDPNVPGGTATIPAYENYGISAGTGIVNAQRQLRTWTTAVGTPGTGEYKLTGGAPIAGNVSSYSNDFSANDSIWAIDGQWGGIVLAGYAETVVGYANNTSAFDNTINNGTINVGNGNASGTRGVQLIEGMAAFPVYALGGGDNDNDDSGILRFIDLRYGGYVIAAAKELNSYSFYGVGKNTVAEFLADWNNADDSFEFWGGAVNLRRSLSVFPGDDGLDTDQGYLGTIQFFVQLQNNAINAAGTTTTRATTNVGDNMSENDGPENGNSAVPYSNYTLANATFVGRGYNDIAARSIADGNTSTIEPATGPNYKDNASAKVYNSIFMDAPHGAMLIMDRRTPTDSGNLGSGGNSAINRFYAARSTGGFDAAGRAADLTTSQTGNPGEADGLFNNVWFYRCGLLDTGAAGIGGKYANLAALTADISANPDWWKPTADSQLFPDRTDRTERGAGSNGTANRANYSSLVTVIKGSPGVVFDQDPGLSVPYSHRTSGIDLKVSGAARDLASSAIPTNRGTGSRKLNADATFIGAVRDSSWFRGWNQASQSGIFSNTVVAIAPEVTIAVVSNRPVVTFAGSTGVKFAIESSSDNKHYAPVTTIQATNDSNVSWTDNNNTVGVTPLFYRVIAL